MSGHVMVFAPTPRLTVTVDQPSDAPELHLHPGGQGVWQARMIMSLGVDVVLCTALGGEIGQVLEPLLVSEGVDLKVVVRDSGSGGYVHDRREGSRREIVDVPGQPLSRHELDGLYNLALGEGLRAPVSVLSGPNEPSVRRGTLASFGQVQMTVAESGHGFVRTSLEEPGQAAQVGTDVALLAEGYASVTAIRAVSEMTDIDLSGLGSD